MSDNNSSQQATEGSNAYGSGDSGNPYGSNPGSASSAPPETPATPSAPTAETPSAYTSSAAPTTNPDTPSIPYATPAPEVKLGDSCTKDCDKKTELSVQKNPDTPKKPMSFDGMFPIILCALFILFIQWLASSRRNSLIDASKPSSIISGASLGYILTKGIPFVLGYLPEAATKINNLYLKDLKHLLLVSFITLSAGFIINYTFEKRSARNIMEDVPHGPFLYGTNLLFLGFVNVLFGLHFVTLFKSSGLYELMLAVMLLGGLIYIESINLNSVYSGRSAAFRQVFLSIAIVVGILLRKMPFFEFTPIMGILTYSFIMGYFSMSALRIEFALVKRTCHYQTFLISFATTVALILIYSLYASIKC